jgi:hypothetical protein
MLTVALTLQGYITVRLVALSLRIRGIYRGSIGSIDASYS